MCQEGCGIQLQGVAPPFEFAIFFSSVLAVSPDSRYAEGAIQKLISRKLDFAAAVDLGDLTADERVLADVLIRVIKPAQNHNAMLPDFDLDVYSRGDGTQAPRILVPALVDEKVSIPTVHVTGKRDADFMKGMSEISRRLCDERMMKILEHPGGHQPPQDALSVRAAVGAMEWAIRQAQKKNMY
ncbi:hypothetical protein CFAM422_007028 [Trichoderma lentiforme]|uniref:Serine hydrolase domain-containing protein n=1 Tax=Trichoderma lentiforme TaxID=1567552 RepID=A0A9P4XEH3_9HYPO|nr:hypothetical protein CFAM422_007028 [Trichoderma lentiforme]